MGYAYFEKLPYYGENEKEHRGCHFIEGQAFGLGFWGFGSRVWGLGFKKGQCRIVSPMVGNQLDKNMEHDLKA